MKKWILLIALLAAALSQAQAQGGRGFWHQEWTVEKGDSIPLVHVLPVYVFSRPVDLRRYVKGRGCALCGGTGYSGRTGVYEMLEMTNEIVEALNADDTGIFVQAARKQMAGETLRRDAVRLVVKGRTTVDEAMRISNQFED